MTGALLDLTADPVASFTADRVYDQTGSARALPSSIKRRRHRATGGGGAVANASPGPFRDSATAICE
jgi:hypothetical protein